MGQYLCSGSGTLGDTLSGLDPGEMGRMFYVFVIFKVELPELLKINFCVIFLRGPEWHTVIDSELPENVVLEDGEFWYKCQFKYCLTSPR